MVLTLPLKKPLSRLMTFALAQRFMPCQHKWLGTRSCHDKFKWGQKGKRQCTVNTQPDSPGCWVELHGRSFRSTTVPLLQPLTVMDCDSTSKLTELHIFPLTHKSDFIVIIIVCIVVSMWNQRNQSQCVSLIFTFLYFHILWFKVNKSIG